MTSTNLHRAKTAAEGVSSLITVFVALEIIGIVLLVTWLDSLMFAFFGIISILGILLFYYSWQSIYEVLMHIGSPLEEEHVPEEEPVTEDSSRPSDNSPHAPVEPVVPSSQRSSKRCIYSNITLGTKCNNWVDGEGQYCDKHSWVTNPEGN